MADVGAHELAKLCWHEVRDGAREGSASCLALAKTIELAFYG